LLNSICLELDYLAEETYTVKDISHTPQQPKKTTSQLSEQVEKIPCLVSKCHQGTFDDV